MLQHLSDILFPDTNKIKKKLPPLEASLIAFSQITRVPVSFFLKDGVCIWTTNAEMRICITNRSFEEDGFPCEKNLISSMRIASTLPEPYLFVCDSGLLNICTPLAFENERYGYFIAGPVAMGYSMDKVAESFASHTKSFDIDFGRVFSILREMPLFTPKQISYLTALFKNSIDAVMTTRELSVQQLISKEQSHIGKKIIDFKKGNIIVEYPYASEKSLTESIGSGDTDFVYAMFSKYFEDIMVFEDGNISMIKLRLISFFTHLIKTNCKGQKNYESFFALEKINDSSTLKTIYREAEALAVELAKTSYLDIYSGKSKLVMQAIQSALKSYSSDINLKTVAEKIHVSPSYLSSLFKAETGISFTDFLTDLRLKRACELLADTNSSITEIMLESGFTSQSYFAKIFRKKYGITPKEYRVSSAK